MKFIKYSSLFLTVIFLVSCSNSQKNIKDFSAITKGNGILVTNLHSNWKGHNNPLLAKIQYAFGETNKKQSLRYLTQTQEDELKTISLPEGDYIWKFIKFGNYFLGLDRDQGFSIKKGEITYIGDLKTTLDLKLLSMSGGTKVLDNTNAIKAKLDKIDKNLLKNYKFNTKVTEVIHE